ncbi:MAG: succinyl-CoA--3-ketoacid-CoA transferase [Chloroflexi bacterium]|nr:succinyl-CoA--3-ketoacid-CoA transferase [Chloroflexota bacterium]|tara:strand:+ start:1370 stop:2050 length:681 start_codon:yes stop_codon:yes gene_type:complete
MKNLSFNNDPAPRLSRNDIARKAAQFLPNSSIVNLGIGIPSLCANYLPSNIEVLYHAETGLLGYKDLYEGEKGNPNIMDAGGNFPIEVPGMVFFDSIESFNMIRGGHINITVLGAFQVSGTGDLSNWMIPSRGIGSIGGAMDLAENTPTVIVAMEHTTSTNIPKIVEQCTYPLTSKNCVNLIVTDVAVIEVKYYEKQKSKLILKEKASGWNISEVQKITNVELFEE